MIRVLPLAIVFLLSLSSIAQDLTIPDSIAKELTEVEIPLKIGRDATVLVHYPEGYNPKKKYPIMLGLSGGHQSREIVSYCYAAWYRTKQFKDYIMVMPVNTTGMPLEEYASQDIEPLIKGLQSYFPATKSDWIITGTSNGGVATFNFISNYPKLFEGAILAPGAFFDHVKVDDNWKHLKIVMAYGDQDLQSWIDEASKAKENLKDKVHKIETFTLEGQGHILSLDYDIESLFEFYFGL